MTPEQIEVLKLVYTEEGQNLRFETSTAQRLMTYFVTVELALGAWIASAGPLQVPARWTVFLLNLGFGACVAYLIVLNYRRRLEVVMPMRHALEALQLTAVGAYLPDRPIHSWKVNASWRNWYLVLVVLFCTAQAVPMYLLPAISTSDDGLVSAEPNTALQRMPGQAPAETQATALLGTAER
jgi:hypothetical protein